MITRDEARDVLANYRDHEWDTQGFGMLRTYLDEDRVTRLQIWDQRLAVPGASLIHDHPWDFESQVLAGVLYNQRFKRTGNGTKFWERVITPGPNTLDEDDRHPDVHEVHLNPQPIEVYMIGEGYGQSWAEIHCTRYAQGTVTCIDRDRTRGIDKASSIWPHRLGRDGWVSARPHPVTDDLLHVVIGYALQTWWLP